MLSKLLSTSCVSLLLVPLVAASREVAAPSDDSDLEVFITRPDLRPPKFQVHVYEPELVSPGYWFVAPYATLRETYHSTIHQTAQTGPHIYDGNGDLVWSGAYLLEPGRPALDFRAVSVNGTQHLSLIALPSKRSPFHPEGVGLILDPSFTISHEVKSKVGAGVENMHEFRVINDGDTALMLTYQEHAENVYLSNASKPTFLAVGNYGFVELDLGSGRILKEWWSQDRIHVNETTVSAPWNTGESWDWLHLNSVDKNKHGDYLLSARFTNTIYKVSGDDGSIMWRLGGKASSFDMQGFNFSGQHDARFRYLESSTGSEPDVEYISLFDNGAGSSFTTSNSSMGLIVALNTRTMKATLVKDFHRPDREQTIARGNFEILPNSNTLAGWSENAYSTEFTADGRRVLDTKFTSDRFVTYRIYKADFMSNPIDNPTVKAFVYGETPETSTTALYVSWNGATQVSRWRFKDESSKILGTAKRQGFETVLMVSGCHAEVYAEALAVDGTVLGASDIQSSIIPQAWSDADFGRISDASSHYPSLVGSETSGTDGANRLQPSRLDAIRARSSGSSSLFILSCLLLAAMAVAVATTCSRLRRRKLWMTYMRPVSPLLDARESEEAKREYWNS